MSADLANRLLFASAVAQEAGRLARRRFHDPDGVAFTFKGRQDYLTKTDGEVEALVKRRLAAAYPEDALLGEEGGGEVGNGTWIIDPIDGTANFARRIPHFCISIGYLAEGEPVVGVIYAPATDELFAAAKGHGATLNGEPIRATATTALDEATVEFGWTARRPFGHYVDLLSRIAATGAVIRRGGSGALGLAYVAAGRIEAYAEHSINSWDVCAGLVIVKEAGGRVSDFFGTVGAREPGPVLAAAPGIADWIAVTTGIPLEGSGGA
jgi:myo-inositol-1(or 4)-monophosphatase